MPKFNDENTEFQNGQTGHYGFSAVSINTLESSEYTLVTIVLDESGSTSPFRTEMESCLKEIVKACKQSPRADYLLVRLVAFAQKMSEIHGFIPLDRCDLDNYDGVCGNNGNGSMTALYDSSENAILSSLKFATDLSDQDYDVNGIVFVITDGEDNASSSGQKEVKNALQKCTNTEQMESLVSILIGVNIQSSVLSSYIDKFSADAGFSQCINLKDASVNTLAKLAEFVSRSISSQSQALGTGGPSQSLVF
jgi:uncharacterized protein YegL